MEEAPATALSAKIHGKGLGDVRALHDFNDMKFEAIAATY